MNIERDVFILILLCSQWVAAEGNQTPSLASQCQLAQPSGSGSSLPYVEAKLRQASSRTIMTLFS